MDFHGHDGHDGYDGHDPATTTTRLDVDEDGHTHTHTHTHTHILDTSFLFFFPRVLPQTAPDRQRIDAMHVEVLP